MRNDLPKAITAEDVIRRFDLSSLVKDRRKINENKDGLDKTENILYNFIDGILKGLNNTENQVDGKISTWFFTGIPTLENEPANAWDTDSDKNNHIGDLYYDKTNGNTYQFVYGNEEYSWQQVLDDDVNEAMALANSNPDTQDGLRNIFVVDPITPYEVGDMWIKSNGDIYRCIIARASGNLNLAEWVISSEYSNDNYVYDARAIIDSFNEFITANYVCKVLVKTTNNSIELSVSSATTKITNDYTTAISEAEGRAEIREGQVLLSANRYTSGEIARVEGEIGDIADITQTEESDEAKVSFTNVPLSEPINLIIYPINENISYLYPNTGLFPSATLYPKIRTLRFTNTTESTHIDYELPDDLLYYDSDNYDTLELDYANQICRVTKKCKYNNDGSVGLLDETEVTNYPYPQIELTLGDYDIELLCYTAGHIFARLMSNNVYVGQFVTQTKLNASINVLPHTIELTTEEQVSGTQCGITIKLRDANGNELDSEDANITLSGLVKFTDLSNSGSTIINGSNIKTGTIDASLVNVTNINATNIKSGNIQSTNYVANTSGTKIDLSNGTIDTKNFKVDSSGNVSISGYVNATSGSIGGCTISNGLLQIAAARITSGTIDSARIPNLSADKITTGTLNASNVNITNLNASNIKTGSINASNGVTIGGFTIGNYSLYGSTSGGTMNIQRGANASVDFPANGGRLMLGSTSANGVSLTTANRMMISDLYGDVAPRHSFSHIELYTYNGDITLDTAGRNDINFYTRSLYIDGYTGITGQSGFKDSNGNNLYLAFRKGILVGASRYAYSTSEFPWLA